MVILIVEDSDHFREEIRNSLKEKNVPAEFVEARDGIEAMKIIVTTQQLVGSLPIQHHLDVGCRGALKYAPLRVNAGSRKGLILVPDQAAQILPKTFRPREN